MAASEPILFDLYNGTRETGPLPDGCLTVDDGGAGAYVIGPALFDPQINGFAGVDFQRNELSRDELEHAAKALRRSGVSHFLPTLITAGPEELEVRFARLAAAVASSSLLGEMVPGFHLEGPFLSSEPGYIGAHPVEHARDPDWAMFERWQRAASGMIRLVTIAPERPGSEAFIRRAVASGVHVACGHTDADVVELVAACDAGMRFATHLGNGCPSELHRHDNIVARVLGEPRLLASVIPDTIHVPVPALGNLVTALGPGRLAFTTDAMSAAGAPSGRYLLQGTEYEVGSDGVVRLPGTSNFAGSSLRPIDGLLNVSRVGGLSLDRAWRGWLLMRELIAPSVEVPPLAVPAQHVSRPD